MGYVPPKVLYPTNRLRCDIIKKSTVEISTSPIIQILQKTKISLGMGPVPGLEFSVVDALASFGRGSSQLGSHSVI
jgi:hypothetical protein